MTPAQAAIVERVRSGELTVAMTTTIDGNVVRRLIRAGVLKAKHTHIEPSERTYHGRRIPQSVTYIGLSVNEG